ASVQHMVKLYAPALDAPVNRDAGDLVCQFFAERLALTFYPYLQPLLKDIQQLPLMVAQLDELGAAALVGLVQPIKHPPHTIEFAEPEGRPARLGGSAELLCQIIVPGLDKARPVIF